MSFNFKTHKQSVDDLNSVSIQDIDVTYLRQSAGFTHEQVQSIANEQGALFIWSEEVYPELNSMLRDWVIKSGKTSGIVFVED